MLCVDDAILHGVLKAAIAGCRRDMALNAREHALLRQLAAELVDRESLDSAFDVAADGTESAVVNSLMSSESGDALYHLTAPKSLLHICTLEHFLNFLWLVASRFAMVQRSHAESVAFPLTT